MDAVSGKTFTTFNPHDEQPIMVRPGPRARLGGGAADCVRPVPPSLGRACHTRGCNRAESRATPLQEIAEADAADVDIAVEAARRAFDEGPWPKMTGAVRALARAQGLRLWFTLIQSGAAGTAHCPAVSRSQVRRCKRAVNSIKYP